MKYFSLFAGVLLFSLNSVAGISMGRGGKYQIRDRAPTPVYSISGAYIEEADIEGGTDTGIFEVDAQWGCAYFNDTLGGDIDMHLQFGSVFFLQTASLDLPEYVSEISLDIEWVNRLQNGWSIIVGITPGIYSDLETLDGDGFFLPLRFAGVKTFNSKLSGIAGIEYRSDFDRELFPLAGLAWQPDEAFRVELGVPVSMLLWRPDDVWDVYGKFSWKNLTYNLRDRDNDSRETLTLEDFRNTFGIRKMVNDRIAIFFEAGKSYHRSIVFERRNASTVELEMGKASFLKGGIAGFF